MTNRKKLETSYRVGHNKILVGLYNACFDMADCIIHEQYYRGKALLDFLEKLKKEIVNVEQWIESEVEE